MDEAAPTLPVTEPEAGPGEPCAAAYGLPAYLGAGLLFTALQPWIMLAWALASRGRRKLAAALLAAAAGGLALLGAAWLMLPLTVLPAAVALLATTLATSYGAARLERRLVGAPPEPAPRACSPRDGVHLLLLAAALGAALGATGELLVLPARYRDGGSLAAGTLAPKRFPYGDVARAALSGASVGALLGALVALRAGARASRAQLALALVGFAPVTWLLVALPSPGFSFAGGAASRHDFHAALLGSQASAGLMDVARAILVCAAMAWVAVVSAGTRGMRDTAWRLALALGLMAQAYVNVALYTGEQVVALERLARRERRAASPALAARLLGAVVERFPRYAEGALLLRELVDCLEAAGAPAAAMRWRRTARGLVDADGRNEWFARELDCVLATADAGGVETPPVAPLTPALLRTGRQLDDDWLTLLAACLPVWPDRTESTLRLAVRDLTAEDRPLPDVSSWTELGDVVESLGLRCVLFRFDEDLVLEVLRAGRMVLVWRDDLALVEGFEPASGCWVVGALHADDRETWHETNRVHRRVLAAQLDWNGAALGAVLLPPDGVGAGLPQALEARLLAPGVSGGLQAYFLAGQAMSQGDEPLALRWLAEARRRSPALAEATAAEVALLLALDRRRRSPAWVAQLHDPTDETRGLAAPADGWRSAVRAFDAGRFDRDLDVPRVVARLASPGVPEELEAAVALLERVRDRGGPWFAGAYPRRLAQLYGAAGRPADRLAALRLARRRDPDDADLRSELCGALLDAGAPGDALALFADEPARERIPGYLLARAEDALARRAWGEAEGFARRCLDLTALDPRAQAALGRALQGAGRAAEAEPCLDWAARANATPGAR